MRCVIQRVLRASVEVDGNVVGSIERGLCLLVGLHQDDTSQDVDQTVKKILNFRLFQDDQGKPWAKTVVDLGFGILSVSQFTLYAVVNKGNKPDFHLALKPDLAKQMYDEFVTKLRQSYVHDRIQDGIFGAMMNVSLVNDGPVTIIWDTRENKSSSSSSN